jgi:outer membrane usher protein
MQACVGRPRAAGSLLVIRRWLPSRMRRHGVLACRRRGTLAALWLGVLPAAWGAAAVPTRLAVTLLQNDGPTVQLRVRMPAGLEPRLDLTGNDGLSPYRLVMEWDDATVALERPLPELPLEGLGPLQALVLHAAPSQTRLELQLNQAIEPHLRRVADSWVLRLEPAAFVPPVVAAPVTPMPAFVLPPLSPGEAPAPLGPERHPAPANRNRSAPSQFEVLLLDVSINGQRLADVVRAEQWPGDALLLPEDAWQEARLAPLAQRRTLSDGTPAYALDAVAGATYGVNRQSLSLEVNMPASAFLESTLGAAKAMAAPPPRSQPGFVLNYDLAAAYSGNGVPLTSGATLEAIAFNKFGNFVSSFLARDDGRKRTAQRLDTFWRYDMPHRLETLVVGDTTGAAGGWSRPARYGGVRWGRDFGMRPGFVTLPQWTLAGEAGLPSTVEVLVNNVRSMSQKLPPGPFELTNVPVATGAGELNMVVRDLLGRETVVKQSYYSAPRMLAAGLADFSFEGGWLRSGYGQDSYYGERFAAGSWRAGLTQRLTGETRVELQARRRAAGIELVSLLGHWGAGSMALAVSSSGEQGERERGQLLRLGIERSTPRGGGALQYEYNSRAFMPFGEGTGPAVVAQRARERWLASLGGSIWGVVSGGVSYVHQTRWDGDRVQALGVSASVPLWQRAGLSVSLNKRLDSDRAWQAGVNVSLPLDNGILSGAYMDRNADGRWNGVVSAALNPPAGPGLGWRVAASTLESQRVRGGLQYNTSQAEWTLDATGGAQGQTNARAGVRGSLGLLAGLPFASRTVGQGSFAVVEVEGIAGVPVMRSHQVVARTDARGLALVPGLLPWQQNQIEIDPIDLPLDTEVGNIVQQVTPYAGSGSVVKFAVKRTRQALVVLHQPDGQPVPLGTQVRQLPDGPTFLAGRRGEAWLTGLAAGRQQIQVAWPGGGCQMELAMPVAADGIVEKIGPLACRKEAP